MHDFLLIEPDLRNVESPSLSNSVNGSITLGMVESRPYYVRSLRDHSFAGVYIIQKLQRFAINHGCTTYSLITNLSGTC